MCECICGICGDRTEQNDITGKLHTAINEFEIERHKLQKLLRLETAIHERLQALCEFVRVLESNEDFLQVMQSYECTETLYTEIRKCRDTIENARISLFVHCTCNILLPDEGISEDVCLFIAMAACERILTNSRKESMLASGFHTPDAVKSMGCVPFPEVATNQMTPVELDCSISCLSANKQSIDWSHRELHMYILALQRRATILVSGHMCGDGDLSSFAERRAQWSCGIAMLKNAALSATLHGDNIITPPAARVEQFRKWLYETVTKWEGARMRESIARAYKQRMIRIEEIGRNRAFGGQSQLNRARGALDVSEELIHALDLARLATLPHDDCVSLICVIQDIIIMKVFANCLEMIHIDFTSDHVVLDSLREMWGSDTFSSQSDARPLHICETMGGYILRGVEATTGHFTSFSDAALTWYIIFFDTEDPLNIFTN